MKRIENRKDRNILNRSIKGLQKVNKQYANQCSEKGLQSFYPRQQREIRKLLGF